MTLPYERRWAVNNTRQFLVDLMDPKKTPRVPSAVRKEAYRCIKHYPGDHYMEQAAEQAPDVFGDWKMSKAYSPFDYMNAVSFTKEDLIGNSDQPDIAEKDYSPYMVNRGFANFEDTILHANELNQRHHLFHGAQFDYYRGALRKRKRFSKWPKADKSDDLDAIQQVYSCNRTVAKLYFKALTKDDLTVIHNKMNIGGVSK